MKIVIDPITSKRYEQLDDEITHHGSLTVRDCQILMDALDLLETAAQIRKHDHACLPCRREYKTKYGRRAEEALKGRARAAVSRAILSGIIRRKPCKKCGKKNAEAHHPDYSKPLRVVWLCEQHHRELHVKIRKGKNAKKTDK